MSTPARKPASLEERLEKRIKRKRGDVFLRADFSDLGGYDQIGRALLGLVRKGRLIRIGQGLYARARRSSLDNKLRPEQGIATLKEALRRLGVETVPTRFERAYNDGRSEQVPTGRVVAIRGKRVRRKIGYDGVFLGFERAERPDQRRKIPHRAATPTALLTAREALRLIWEADRYPVRGNEDWRMSAILAKEARVRAATARTSPDDPPEFAIWIAALLDSKLAESEREDIMSAIYSLFEADEEQPDSQLNL